MQHLNIWKAYAKETLFLGGGGGEAEMVTVCSRRWKRPLSILQLKHNLHLLPVIFRHFLCSQFLCSQNCVTVGMVTRESIIAMKVEPISDFLRELYVVTIFRKHKKKGEFVGTYRFWVTQYNKHTSGYRNDFKILGYFEVYFNSKSLF